MKLLPSVGRDVSIRWLLAGCLAVLFVGLFAALGGTVYLQVAGYLEWAGELQLRSEVYTGFDRSRDALAESDAPAPVRRGRRLVAAADFEAHVDELAHAMGSRLAPVLVISPSGQVLAAYPAGAQAPAVDLARLKEVEEAVARSGVGHATWHESSGRRTWQVLLLPVLRDGRIAAFIQAAASRRPASDLLLALRRYLVYSCVAACVLGLLTAFWLSRVISRPLERLAATTRRVARGDLEARTGLEGGSNEIHAVAQDFDRMVERLQAAFRAQRRFVADASHELKTPLTAIGGMAEMLGMGADAGDERKRGMALATIERQVDRMTRLLDDLLALARAEQAPVLGAPDEADHPGTGGAPLDVPAALGEAAEVVRGAHPGRVVEVRLEGSLPSVVGDRDAVVRVVRNLLENAIKYSPEGGAVTVAARAAGGRLEIEVVDRGVGIAASDLPHVFEPFYRADPSRARRTGGSGLGLSIVRAVVERHGGRVAIESRPGEGTTVRVHLPAAAPPVSP